MNALWPTDVRHEVGLVARFGRVLHWLCVLGAGACAIGAAVTAWRGEHYPALMALAFAAGFFMFGRALRYVLSGE